MGVETAIIVGAVASLATTGVAVKQGLETRKTAKAERRTRDRIAQANARAKFIQERRSARMLRARASAAEAASGAQTSTFLGDVIGSLTGENAAIARIEEEQHLQMQQNKINQNLQIAAANTQIAEAIGTFTAQFAGPIAGALNAPNVNAAAAGGAAATANATAKLGS